MVLPAVLQVVGKRPGVGSVSGAEQDLRAVQCMVENRPGLPAERSGATGVRPQRRRPHVHRLDAQQGVPRLVSLPVWRHRLAAVIDGH